jgi:hypothetical protein
VTSPEDDADVRQRELRAVQWRRNRGPSLKSAWHRKPGGGRQQGDEDGSTAPRHEWNKAKLAESAKIDLLEERLLNNLHQVRPLLAGGRAVLHPVTREPLMERQIDLAVVDRLLHIAERRTKLLGIDAPHRREVQVVPEEMVEEMIREVTEQEARLDVGLGGGQR